MKDKQLPMAVNEFYAIVVKSRPKGTTLNVKHSSYKKVLAFLQSMEENELITLKETAKGVWVVTEINRSDVE